MMKKFSKWITSPTATIALFAVAAGLLLFSTIGGAYAALTYFSETYVGQIELQDIGVTLMEKGEHDDAAKAVAYRDYTKDTQDDWKETEGETHTGILLSGMLAEDEVFVPGKAYKEEISCANTGTIDQYVRITLRKYWTDPEGNKVFTKEKDTDYTTPVKFTFPNSGSWILDTQNSSETEERQIYYYSKLLPAGSDTTGTPLTDTLTVDPSVTLRTTKTISDDGKTITTSYDYDGWQFCIEATVDAVQDHNAEDAIKSAWGRDVTISDGTLQLD